MSFISDCVNLGAIPVGAYQDQRQDWSAGRSGDCGDEQAEDCAHVRDTVFEALSQVLDQEVLEEEQSARLAARDRQQQGGVRAALLQHRPGRRGRGRELKLALSVFFFVHFVLSLK